LAPSARIRLPVRPLIGEIDYFTHEQHHVLDWYRNNKPLKEAGYSTTLIGNEAVK